MGKLIIENQSIQTDSKALEAVIIVINKGRISKNNTQYSRGTTFRSPPVAIFTDLNKNSDRFVVVDYEG